MPLYKKITLTAILFYLIVPGITDFSLTGFWTDILASIGLTLYAFRQVSKYKTGKNTWIKAIRVITVVYSIILGVFLAFSLVFMHGWDFSKLRSFYFQKVDGRIFHAYFKPVGAYSGGEGNFWITESLIFLPFIEKEVYYKHAILHDFNDDTWEGEPIDNYEIVKEYIKDEVIDKNR